MKRSPFYRILVIVLCYAIVGIFLFMPFAADKNRNWIVFWIVIGVYAAALIATIVVEEIQTARRIKKMEEQEKGEGAPVLEEEKDE